MVFLYLPFFYLQSWLKLNEGLLKSDWPILWPNNLYRLHWNGNFSLDFRKVGVIYKDFIFLLMFFSNIKYHNLVGLVHSTKNESSKCPLLSRVSIGQVIDWIKALSFRFSIQYFLKTKATVFFNYKNQFGAKNVKPNHQTIRSSPMRFFLTFSISHIASPLKSIIRFLSYSCEIVLQGVTGWSREL